MKKILTITLTFVSFLLQAQQTKVLWIGNSYTSVNNLPKMFHDLALSGGDSVTYDSNTPGGYTFNQQSVNATTIQKIYSQQWDYVVLQAQSQEPSFPPSQVQTETFPYARVLDSLIHDNDSCTQTVFYMTWGKKFGDQANCATYPAICTFEGVTDRLRDSYLQMANDNNAIVAPAGMAWFASWHADTLINLWQADNSHPTIAGSYLTACVFYESIFRKSPVGLSYSPIAVQATTNFLQSIAHTTVFDSLTNWNIGVYNVMSSFSFTGNESTKIYSFNNLSQNFTAYQWNFGDGNFSNTSGTHTYADTGIYTTTLIAFDNCGNSDTSSQTVSIHAIPTQINLLDEERFTVYPNPIIDELCISGLKFSLENNRLEIYDVTGKKIADEKVANANCKLQTENWQPGIYFVKTNGVTKKIVKL